MSSRLIVIKWQGDKVSFQGTRMRDFYYVLNGVVKMIRRHDLQDIKTIVRDGENIRMKGERLKIMLTINGFDCEMDKLGNITSPFIDDIRSSLEYVF